MDTVFTLVGCMRIPFSLSGRVLGLLEGWSQASRESCCVLLGLFGLLLHLQPDHVGRCGCALPER